MPTKDDLQAALDQANARIAELEAQVEAGDSSGKIAELKASNDELQNALGEKQAKHDRSNSRILELEDANKIADDKITELGTELNAADATTKGLREDIDGLHKDLGETNSKVSELEDQNKGLRAHNEEISEAASAMAEKLEDAGIDSVDQDDQEALEQAVQEAAEIVSKRKAQLSKAQKSLSAFEQEAMLDTGKVLPSVMDGNERRELVRDVIQAKELHVESKAVWSHAKDKANPILRKVG